MKSLRILHVCPRPAFSGLEQYAFQVAEAQKKLGHEVTFFTLSGAVLEKKAADAGMAVWSLGISSFRERLEVFRRVRRWCSQGGVIHVHSTQEVGLLFWPLVTLPRSIRRQVKFIVQTHIWIDRSKKDPLHAMTYSQIDEMWCSSALAKRSLETHLPVAEFKIKVVNYGRPVAVLDQGFLGRNEARKALNLPLDVVLVVNVARIDQGKGTDEFLMGGSELLKSFPDLHLVFIGGATTTDPKANEFSDFIRQAHEKLAYRERIHFLGEVKDSYKYLKAFDLFILPSYKECFALSLLEAMAAGLPVLGTNSGGTPEVVREDQTGWLFEPRSREAVTEALRKALREKDRWLRYGQNSRERVVRDFDFAKVLPQILDHYRV